MMCEMCSEYEGGRCHGKRSPFRGTLMNPTDQCDHGTPSVFMIPKKAGGGLKVRRIRKITSVYDYEFNYKVKKI